MLVGNEKIGVAVDYTSLVAGIKFEDSLFVGISEHLSREAQDGRCLADSRHAGDDHMRHVAILRDDLQPFDSLRVAHDVVEVNGSILLHPTVS